MTGRLVVRAAPRTVRASGVPDRHDQSGMRTCTVVLPEPSSTHQRSTSACTMLSPRPETAERAGLDHVRAGGAAAAVADGDDEVVVLEAPGDDEVVHRERGGVPDAVADELGDDDAGVLDGLPAEPALLRASRGARGAPGRPTVPGRAPSGSPSQAQPASQPPTFCLHMT